MALPSGTVTFLFTDIEGSTKLAQQYPDAMPVLLARHNQILHQTIERYNGYVFQVVGDSFAAAFHSASDALNAAVDAQKKLYSETWTPGHIKVRMGIHTGAAQLQIDSNDNAYAGYATLASAQRIMSAGHGGQILLSGATRELVRDVLPENTELLDVGKKRLKDLLRPEHLYQLNILELSSTFPPLKTLDAFPNNLPTQLTTFIGRENEIAEVKQELEAHRLVTLTGSGGTGKTRLSLQVAADLLEKFDHGVWFVELAPLTDSDLIPQTILSTIGVQEQQGKTPLEVLKEYLHEKQALIVLDNCEHLVSASAEVVNTLLNAAPKLKILASSREALSVKGEMSYPVPSLSLPDIKHLPVIEQLSQYEAVRLFIDRVLLVAPHFVVEKDNAPHIAQICYRLDGIPLAIELAAARVKMLSVEQISKRLDDRFRLLTGGARTALPRQQTLRALIDWSYDILSENERLLLRRLSVFAGGWTLEAAEEVCVGQDDTLPYDVLDLLTQLVNKSLVVVIEYSQSGETRYRMLETIRQYTREKLQEAGDGEVIRDQHLAYFAKLVELAEPELYLSNQAFWLNKLDDELDNLRMAMEWSLTSDAESGLRIAALSWRWCDMHSYFREIGEWLSQFLERYSVDDSLHAQALFCYSGCLIRQGRFAEAFQIAEQCLQMALIVSDKHTEAHSLQLLGALTSVQGKVEEGILLMEQGLDLYRALGYKIGQANVLSALANNSSNRERAAAFARESLQISRELGNLSGIAESLAALARLSIWRGDFSSPAAWLDEALSMARQVSDQATEQFILLVYGVLMYWQGNYRQSHAYYKEVIQLSERLGNHFTGLWAHVHMAYMLLQQGAIGQARELFEECIQRAYKADWKMNLVFAVEGIASLNVNQGQSERAGRLFAWTDAMRDEIGDQRPPIEQASVEKDLAVIHSSLNDVEFEKLSTQGRAMATEQAIALALES